MALVNSSASWAESITVTNGSNANPCRARSRLGCDVGRGYVSAKLSWQLSRRWNVEGGVQFQDLGVYRRSLGGRTVEMDLSKSMLVTVGRGLEFLTECL